MTQNSIDEFLDKDGAKRIKAPTVVADRVLKVAQDNGVRINGLTVPRVVGAVQKFEAGKGIEPGWNISALQACARIAEVRSAVQQRTRTSLPASVRAAPAQDVPALPTRAEAIPTADALLETLLRQLNLPVAMRGDRVRIPDDQKKLVLRIVLLLGQIHPSGAEEFLRKNQLTRSKIALWQAKLGAPILPRYSRSQPSVACEGEGHC